MGGDTGPALSPQETVMLTCQGCTITGPGVIREKANRGSGRLTWVDHCRDWSGCINRQIHAHLDRQDARTRIHQRAA